MLYEIGVKERELAFSNLQLISDCLFVLRIGFNL